MTTATSMGTAPATLELVPQCARRSPLALLFIGIVIGASFRITDVGSHGALLKSFVGGQPTAVNITAAAASSEPATATPGASGLPISVSLEPTWVPLAPARVIVTSVGYLASDWMLQQLADLCVIPYHHKDSPDAAVPYQDSPNLGRDSSVLLSFIVDHYDHLPGRLLFLHGHENSWHSNHLVGIIRHLNWNLE